MDSLPEPQRRALNVAFGLESGPPADPFLVGLAVLTLLSDVAETTPVLCVVDDAQWLDEESADLLSFVARRLLADRVGLLFGVRETAGDEPRLQALPSRRLPGLPEQAARELLKTSVSRPIDPHVANRIVAETEGNPLAVVEAAGELTPDQLGGTEPLPEPLPVGHRLEASYLRRVRELPPDTQTLLVLAAAGSPGQGHLMWQAAAEPGHPRVGGRPRRGGRPRHVLAPGALPALTRALGGVPRCHRCRTPPRPPRAGLGERSRARRGLPRLAVSGSGATADSSGSPAASAEPVILTTSC